MIIYKPEDFQIERQEIKTIAGNIVFQYRILRRIYKFSVLKFKTVPTDDFEYIELPFSSEDIAREIIGVNCREYFESTAKKTIINT